MKTSSKLLTTTEVAEILRVHPNTIRQWSDKGLIHVYRLGPRGDRRFKRGDVDGFLRQDGADGAQQDDSNGG
jgi:DNA binding domain, excisionase family